MLTVRAKFLLDHKNNEKFVVNDNYNFVVSC